MSRLGGGIWAGVDDLVDFSYFLDPCGDIHLPDNTISCHNEKEVLEHSLELSVWANILAAFLVPSLLLMHNVHYTLLYSRQTLWARDVASPPPQIMFPYPQHPYTPNHRTSRSTINIQLRLLLLVLSTLNLVFFDLLLLPTTVIARQNCLKSADHCVYFIACPREWSLALFKINVFYYFQDVLLTQCRTSILLSCRFSSFQKTILTGQMRYARRLNLGSC